MNDMIFSAQHRSWKLMPCSKDVDPGQSDSEIV
jgi:hypothetical protein